MINLRYCLSMVILGLKLVGVFLLSLIAIRAISYAVNGTFPVESRIMVSVLVAILVCWRSVVKDWFTRMLNTRERRHRSFMFAVFLVTTYIAFPYAMWIWGYVFG